MKKLLTLASVALLTGCATNDYALYAETQKAIAQARAVSEAARYNALAEIAKTGDSAAKVAAVLSIQMGGSPTTQAAQNVAPPKTIGDTALQWTSILLPSLTQIYGINQNARTAITQSNNTTAASIAQSNNQAAIAASTNQAFTNIASQIQAPQANVTTTTTNTDSSNRSTTTTNTTNTTNTTTTNTDSSNRSNTTTTTTDSSNRPTTTNDNSNNTGTGGP